MAIPASEVAEQLTNTIRKQGKDYVTVSWEKFYELADRDRLKDAFMKKLENELKKRSFLMKQGNSVVIVAKDFDSHPLET